MEVLILYVFLGSIMGFVGWLLARSKGRGVAGFWWSFFLGIIGWIIAAALEPSDEVKTERLMQQARIIKDAMRE